MSRSGALSAGSGGVLTAKDYGVGIGSATTDYATALQRFQDALRDAGPGARGILPPGTILSAGTIFLDDFVSIEAHHAGTVLKLADGSNVNLLETRGRATHTGTTDGGGPKKFSLRRLKLHGNRANNASGYGLRIWGYDYLLEDLEFFYFAGKGVTSEWAEGAAPYTNAYWSNNTEFGQMKAVWRNVDIHHCLLGGAVLDGPHDSDIIGGQAYKNGPDDDNAATSTVGLEIGSGNQDAASNKGNSCMVTGFHTWGVNQGTGILLGANNCEFTACQAEGAKNQQVWLLTSDNRFRGGRYFRGDSRASDIAFRLGDASRSISVGDNQIDVNLKAGRVHFDSDGGQNEVKLHAYNAYGAQTAHLAANTPLPPAGGTLTVDSTAGWPRVGNIAFPDGQVAHYSGLGAGGTTFTGVVQATGTPLSGTALSGATLTMGFRDALAPQYAITGTQHASVPNDFDVKVYGGGMVGDLGPIAQRRVTRSMALAIGGRSRGPKGNLGQTLDRTSVAQDGQVLTLGQLQLAFAGIVLAEEKVSAISFVKGATDETGGTFTHQWFGLWTFDGTNWLPLAVTHDDTTTAWTKSGAGLKTGEKKLAIEQVVAGPALAAQAFWQPREDTPVWAGIVLTMTAGTPPTLAYDFVNTGVSSIGATAAPTPNGYPDALAGPTGFTDPASVLANRPLSVVTVVSKAPYAYLS